MRDAIKVVIADDHALVRQGIAALLKHETSYEVVGVASNANDALQLVDSKDADVLLIDLSMPGTSGVEAIRIAKRKQETLKAVALTFHTEPHFIRAALDAGATGYVLKTEGIDDLLTCLKSVSEGLVYISPRVGSMVVSGFLGNNAYDGHDAINTLTRREREVTKLIAEGLLTREIAAEMSVSTKTIEKHRANMMKKLQLRNTAEVTAFAINNGLAQG